MRYTNVSRCRFLERPNRFLARVEMEGQEVLCHVKNTGRCRELLNPGAVVYLQKSDNPNRKTGYDLIAVEKGEMLINMDSQIPNYVAAEWLRKGSLFPEGANIQMEKRYGNSRFDIYAEAGERKAFLEVKGVTLEVEGQARFPDAPTERGVKHVRELMGCVQEGYEAYLLFVIQMTGIQSFAPNWDTHPAFGSALQEAARAGVQILAYDCQVRPDDIVLDQPVPVLL
ncbi:MAG: DNA/RNA nuclease SfsA [Lachnospiraceae bacterium]|nr:DNA/RNA nuclease SfsA [Lachnospiraceae bacterium]